MNEVMIFLLRAHTSFYNHYSPIMFLISLQSITEHGSDDGCLVHPSWILVNPWENFPSFEVLL